MADNESELKDAEHGFSKDWRLPPPAGHYGFMTETQGACPWCSIGEHDQCWGPCACLMDGDAVH